MIAAIPGVGPQSLSSISHLSSVQLSWTSPPLPDQNPVQVISYQVIQTSPPSPTVFSSTSTQQLISSLTPNSPFSFSVRAVTAWGITAGSPSLPTGSASTRLFDHHTEMTHSSALPDRVQGLQQLGLAQSNDIQVSWTSMQPGNLEILHYRVQVDGGVTETVTELEYTIRDATAGIEYLISVAAVNVFGQGPPAILVTSSE